MTRVKGIYLLTLNITDPATKILCKWNGTEWKSFEDTPPVFEEENITTEQLILPAEWL